MVSFKKSEMIFAQGDEMDGLFFIHTGKRELRFLVRTGPKYKRLSLMTMLMNAGWD
jgi:hypothetical protein